jgi:predicted enzyme related to lactoylglutathione lyase
MDLGDLQMAFFPEAEVGIALCFSPWYKPSDNGVLVYLDGNPDLQVILDRIEKSGGKIIQPKKQISPDHGFMCLFLDSEGNRLALHSAS